MMYIEVKIEELSAPGLICKRVMTHDISSCLLWHFCHTRRLDGSPHDNTTRGLSSRICQKYLNITKNIWTSIGKIYCAIFSRELRLTRNLTKWCKLNWCHLKSLYTTTQHPKITSKSWKITKKYFYFPWLCKICLYKNWCRTEPLNIVVWDNGWWRWKRSKVLQYSILILCILCRILPSFLSK